MTVRTMYGDLLNSEAPILVNTVNCVGVMGAGIALQFRQRFPHNYAVYRRACDRKLLKPGGVLRVSDDGRTILNVATKDHWRNPSQLVWIEQILHALYTTYAATDDMIAMPLLGCGLGGLNPETVKLLIHRFFSDVSVQVLVYQRSK